MIVYLIRHAQTAGNLLRRYIGITDEPLCPEGVAAARGVGVFPSVRQVVTSPMTRACQTAQLLFPNAVLHIETALREMDFGSFEGKSAYEMTDDNAYLSWVNGGCVDACPDGESLALFQERVSVAFDCVIQQAVSKGMARLVIVAHGGTIRAILHRYARPVKAFWDWSVGPCEVYETRVDEGSWQSNPYLSECFHLESLTL